MKNFTRDASRAKEVTNTVLNSSEERRHPPSTSNVAPNQTITNDRISMKILSEIYLTIGKSPLHFGKIICRAQTSANAQGYNNSPNILITNDRIIIKFLPEIDLEPSPHDILETIHGAHTSAKTPAMTHQ